MKKSICILILAVFIASCSTQVSDIQTNKIGYVKSAIICDSKSTNFTVLNQDDLFEFLSDDEPENFWIKYQYEKQKGIAVDRKIEIKRWNNGAYTVAFKRKTFPFSDCRKLKTKPKYFK